MTRLPPSLRIVLAIVAPALVATHLARGAEPRAGGEVVGSIAKDVWYVYQARNGDYWFGSHSNGAYRYDGKTIRRYSTQDGLPGDSVGGFQEDAEGNLYVESGGRDVGKFDGVRFTALPAVESNEWRLEPGDLWFKGTALRDGPSRYDGKVVHRLKFPKHPLEESLGVDVNSAIGSPYSVYTITKDRRGSVWFGTAVLGACRYDGTTWQWLYENDLTNTPSGGSFGIRSIHEDKDSRFWICNSKYRYAVAPDGFDERGPAFVRYRREAGIVGLPASLAAEGIYFQGIVEDAEGVLWMSTYRGGIWRWDGKTATRYPVLDGEEPTTVFGIYQDRGGGLWLGSPEAGPYRFDGKAFVKFEP